MKRSHSLLLLVAGLVTVLALAESLQAQVMARQLIRRMPNRPAGDVPVAPANKDAGSMHIPRTKQVGFPQVWNDGGNFRWDIQHNLHLGSGTNNAYAQYNAPLNIQSINGQGWGGNGTGQGFVNKDGDEIEIGPLPMPNIGLTISRRLKVYKDAPLARWIDIFENTSGQEITVSYQVNIGTCWQIASIKTNSGKGNWTEEDWGFCTELMQQGQQNVPNLLHIVCDKKTKFRPQIQVGGNQALFRYAFRLPAKSVAAICYFESQIKTTDDGVKFMGDFKAAKYFKDLPGSARRLILNFGNLGGVAGVDLERSETADSILLQRGDPMFGKITNANYAIQTLFGDMTLDAKQVVGMATRPGGETVFALTDGQIISGKCPNTKIELTLASGGNLSVPLDQIQQWSYQIDKVRPADISLQGAAVVLRTGDQLILDSKALKLDFSTRHGKMQLQGKDIFELTMDNAANGVHRALFLNGSMLGGLLEGEKLTLPVKIGKEGKMELPRELIYKFSCGGEVDADPSSPTVALSNGDELYARLTDASLKISSEFGNTDIKAGSIKKMDFSTTHLDRVQVTLFDGTVLKGQLEAKELSFQLTSDTTMKISTAQLVSITQTTSLPTDEAVKKAEQWIARLGAESYLDREKATEELSKLGDSVVPTLRKHLKESDPEVRQRLQRVIEKLGGRPDEPASPPNPMMIMAG